MTRVGYVSGTCKRCGREITRPIPEEVAYCDCWKYCPNDHGNGRYATLMDPYEPDLTPRTYRGIKVKSGTTHGDLDHPMSILRVCPVCNHHSKQLPVEVSLT